MEIPLVDVLPSPLGFLFKGASQLSFRGKNSAQGFLFEAVRQEKPFQAVFYTVWHKEDSLHWNAFRDLVDCAAQAVQAKLRGFFRYEIFWIDPDLQALRLDMEAFGTLLANHARTLKPGERRFLKYSGLYGIFRQTVAEEWGKIDFELPIDRISYGSDKFDLLLKRKMIPVPDFPDFPATHIFCDLSDTPVFNPVDQEGMARIHKWFEKNYPADAGAAVPPVYFIHKKDAFHLNSFLKKGLKNDLP